MRKTLTITLFTLCLGSCFPGHNDYSDFRQMEPYGWRYADVLTFEPTGADSLATGALTVALRHTNDYLYSNLYLEVGYTDPHGRHQADTINMILADRYGRWLGKGIGTDFQITETINPRFRRIKGTPVTVRHIMRVDTITGIDLVGLSFVSE